MKKSLLAIVFAFCISNVSGMDAVIESGESEVSSFKTCPIFCKAESKDTIVVSVFFNDTTSSANSIAVSFLENDKPFIVTNGIEIFKRTDGCMFLNVSKDSRLRDAIKYITVLTPQYYTHILHRGFF